MYSSDTKVFVYYRKREHSQRKEKTLVANPASVSLPVRSCPSELFAGLHDKIIRLLRAVNHVVQKLILVKYHRALRFHHREQIVPNHAEMSLFHLPLNLPDALVPVLDHLPVVENNDIFIGFFLFLLLDLIGLVFLF